jgi:hypothetical protein
MARCCRAFCREEVKVRGPCAFSEILEVGLCGSRACSVGVAPVALSEVPFLEGVHSQISCTQKRPHLPTYERSSLVCVNWNSVTSSNFLLF